MRAVRVGCVARSSFGALGASGGLGKPGPLGVLVGLVALSTAAGCDCRGNIEGSGLMPPTVDNLPQKTNQVPLAVAGTRGASTAVWIHLDSEADAQQVAAPESSSAWSGTLSLREGTNVFVAFATDAEEVGFSANSGPYTVILDTIPPAAPRVDAYPDPYFIGENGTEIEVTFTGTKDVDASLLVDGSEEVAIDGAATWSFTRVLTLGPHEIVLQSADDVGNLSPSVTLAITMTDVPGPLLDAVRSPTNVRHQVITGTRAASTSAFLSRPGASELSLSPVAAGEVNGGARVAFSHDMALKEGPNAFYVFARREGHAYESEHAHAVIVLDTIPPSPPVVDPIVSPTQEASAAVTGARAPDGNLCVRANQQPTCTEMAPVDGTTAFDVLVPLAVGNNYLCVSSVDLAGNQSAEVCRVVVKVPPPEVRIVAPADGGVVSGGAILVQVQASGSGAPGTTISGVEVCLDTDVSCVAATLKAGSADLYEASIPTAGLTPDTEHTITATATSSIGSADASVTVTYSGIGVRVLSDHGGNAAPQRVRLAYDKTGSRALVVWDDQCSQSADCEVRKPYTSPADVFLRALAGGTWQAPEVLSFVSQSEDAAGRGDDRSERPDIAVDGAGTAHVVWIEYGNVNGKGTDGDVLYRSVTSAGAISDAVVVTNSTVEEYLPAIAAEANGTLHLVFERYVTDTDHDIYYKRYSGSTWSADLLVSDSPNDGDSRNAAIAVDKDGVAHVVWQDDGDIGSSGTADKDIFYRTVTNATTLSAYIVVSANDLSKDCFAPAVAVDPSDTTKAVHIVWHGKTDNLQLSGTDQDIWYRRYYNGAPDGTAYTLVSQGSNGDSAGASVAVAPGGKVIVVWAEADPAAAGNTDIMMAVGENKIFNTPSLVVATEKSSVSPAVVVGAGTSAHVVWRDGSTVIPADTGTDNDIFYKLISF